MDQSIYNFETSPILNLTFICILYCAHDDFDESFQLAGDSLHSVELEYPELPGFEARKHWTVLPTRSSASGS